MVNWVTERGHRKGSQSIYMKRMQGMSSNKPLSCTMHGCPSLMGAAMASWRVNSYQASWRGAGPQMPTAVSSKGM